MWDFEHPPLDSVLAHRYKIDRTSPSDCAARLAAGTADIGLVPIAALAANPTLRILPGCTIASKGRVRSLLLVRRATQPLASLRSVAADTASRTTLAYARILFHRWGNPRVPFLPLAADLDRMLEKANAAILIGDPALLALEKRTNRFARTGEELVYHDLAEEWTTLTGLPFVSAVWGIACSGASDNIRMPQVRGPRGQVHVRGVEISNLRPGIEDAPVPRPSVPGPLVPVSLDSISHDFLQSRDHGLANLDALVAEWSSRLPIPEPTLRTYLASNIHYILDDDCIAGMKAFFREAAALAILPQYQLCI
jgi:chorismate dehydratase